MNSRDPDLSFSMPIKTVLCSLLICTAYVALGWKMMDLLPGIREEKERS